VTTSGSGDGFRKGILGLVVAAAVPLFGFWQQASYLPSQNQASLVVTPSAVLEADPTGGKHWVITVKAESKSPTRAVVIVSNTVICHWKSEQERSASTAEELSSPNCLRLTDPFGQSSYLDASGSLTYVDSTAALADRPLASVFVRVAIARGDRFRELMNTSHTIAVEGGGCDSVRTFALQDDTRYKSLVGGTNDFSFFTRSDGGRNYAVAPEPLTGCPDAVEEVRDEQLEDYYGISESRQFWVGWVAPPEAGSAPATT